MFFFTPKKDYGNIENVVLYDHQKNYNEKLRFFSEGKKVKVRDENGKKIIVNTRKEFLSKYPIVALTNTIDDLREISNKIDKMEPLDNLVIRFGIRDKIELNKEQIKYIEGKYVPKNVADAGIDTIALAIRNMSMKCLPELPSIPDSSTEEFDTMFKCMRIFEEIIFCNSTGSCEDAFSQRYFFHFIEPDQTFSSFYKEIEDAGYHGFKTSIKLREYITLFHQKVIYPARVFYGDMKRDDEAEKVYDPFDRTGAFELIAGQGISNFIRIANVIDDNPERFFDACKDDSVIDPEGKTVIDKCGYIPDNEAIIQKAMEPWNEFLPEEYRGNLEKIKKLGWMNEI